MSTVAYGCQSERFDNCLLDPPELCGCEPVCEPECHCSTRNNKTRARDRIKIGAGEVERWFSLTEWGCDSKPIPATINCIELVLRRKGHCKNLACLTPVRATADAAVQFQWPEWFLRGQPGYYEGDVIINGVEHNTVLLYLPPHAANVDDTEGVESNFPCISSCAIRGASCYAVPDGEPGVEDTGCDTEVCESC